MNITESDLAIAATLYPVLVECARHSPPRKVTYGELLATAKTRFPSVEAVQTAIPISLGRRLDVVRMFLDEQKLPNLTSLIINADTGEVGSAFGQNPEQVRQEVASIDWGQVSAEFDLHILGLRKALASRQMPKLNREDAKRIMSEYYAANRRSLPPTITAKREEIIEMLCNRIAVEDAFALAVST